MGGNLEILEGFFLTTCHSPNLPNMESEFVTLSLWVDFFWRWPSKSMKKWEFKGQTFWECSSKIWDVARIMLSWSNCLNALFSMKTCHLNYNNQDELEIWWFWPSKLAWNDEDPGFNPQVKAVIVSSRITWLSTSVNPMDHDINHTVPYCTHLLSTSGFCKHP